MENATIFISYANQDADFALQLATDLRNAGAAIWMDQLDIHVGKRWDREVQKALDVCDSLLVVLTPDAVASEPVNDEIGCALDDGKTVIPVLLKNCTIPLRIRRLQYANFTQAYEKGFNKLIRSLHLKTETEPVAKPVPAKPVVKTKEESQAVYAALTAIKQKNTAPAKPIKTDKKPKATKAASARTTPVKIEKMNLISFDQVTIGKWKTRLKSVKGESQGTLIVHERSLQFKSFDGDIDRFITNIHSIKYYPATRSPQLIENYMLVTYSVGTQQREILFSRFAFFIDKPTLGMFNQVKDMIRVSRASLSK